MSAPDGFRLLEHLLEEKIGYLVVASIVFIVGIVTVGVRVSKREGIPLFLLLLGLRRGVSYTISERVLLLGTFLLSAILLVLAVYTR